MKTILSIFDLFLGGDGSSIAYFFGIGFSVIGGILIANVEQTNHLIAAFFLCLMGGLILFLKIRKDIKE
ncbi:hypothetical protein CW751_11225 [Brumimicrobium salinarum]|uniref:Uncharacterized protein n=1 Tax=Brumimicrobium salinarum TaxID=2058658 RepID=A0A2I0R101_9FLAO|nr:hypothetical protein [Brumimicrobium salinarum]PKR80225.1 hypothetical protein CW751_11225 [Brumimicrobium salinarum]